jgi:hypothetical protein
VGETRFKIETGDQMTPKAWEEREPKGRRWQWAILIAFPKFNTFLRCRAP